MHILDAHPVTDRVVTLRGQVSTGHIENLEEMLWERISRSVGDDVEVDMRAVEFLSAAVVAVLVEAHFRAMQRGNRLRITGCWGQALSMLEACGVLDVQRAPGPAPAAPAVPRVPAKLPPVLEHPLWRTLSRGATTATRTATALRHIGRRVKRRPAARGAGPTLYSGSALAGTVTANTACAAPDWRQ